MKKFTPVIVVLVIFALGLGGAVYAFRQFTKAPNQLEEDGPELPASQRPFSTLTPTEDGYYMDLVITNIDVPGAEKIVFEVFYTTAEGNNQGTRGELALKGDDTIRNQLLLGSESNGNFRFDEGVEMGTLTVKFRDNKGKVIGQTKTTWHMQENPTELTSADGKFAYTLDDEAEGFFVTMNTLGLPGDFNGVTSSESYGVFSHLEGNLPGEVSLSGDVSRWDGEDGEWVSLGGTASEDIGVFISSN